MRIDHLRIERAPGIDQPFELTGFAPGFNVILGPNGSGKSLVCRMVRELLWSSGKVRGAMASAVITGRTGSMDVRCEEDVHEWRAVEVGAQRPLLPPSHSAACFMLHAGDLLSAGGGTDREIANEVKKQMAGGYDLDAVRQQRFNVPPQHGKKARRAVDNAQKSLTRVQEDFRVLAEEEASLADLDRSIRMAGEATERVRVLKILGQLAFDRETLAKLEAKLAALPKGMERLSGAEGERLADRNQTLASSQSELADVDAELEEKLRQLAELGELAGSSTLDEITAWSERAHELKQREERCAVLDEEVEAARGEAREARLQLASECDGQAKISLSAEQLDQLADLVGSTQSLRADLAEVSARLQSLSPTCEVADSRDIERGLEALREWIAHPYSTRELARTPWLWGLGGVLVAVGAWYARQGVDLLWAACGAGAVLWVWAYSMVAAARSGAALRAEARASYPKRDLAPPEVWESLEVRTRLLELESEFADSLAAEGRIAERGFLQQRLAELEETEEELEVQSAYFAESLGLHSKTSSLTLLEVARRLESERAACLRLRERESEAGQSHVARAEQTAALIDWLEGRGLRASDATDALVALRRLDRQAHQVTRLSEEIKILQARRPRLTNEIEQQRERVGQVFSDSGLKKGDLVGLEQRLESLEEYRQLDREHCGVAAQVARLVESLPDSEQELGSLEVGEALRQVEETAAGLQDLVAERAAARERLRAARVGTRMEDALDEVACAREQLEAQREEALNACLGTLLLDEVSEEHRQSSSPEVLKRAVELFGQFTHHKYELQLEGRDGETRFHARDVRRGRLLELEELSDGTRMQLLLAARFAYAFEVEEEPVPFFLDEALSFSDPERLAEIAQVLFALVAEGRQVCYLTSRRIEIEAFCRAAEHAGAEPPHVLDLAQARGLGAVISQPSEVEYEIVPTPAPIGDETPAQYAVRLGVPVPSPESPASGLHLFYLLREDLELLRQLVAASCCTLGQWRASVRTGAARALCSSEAQVQSLSDRASVAEAIFDSWRIGRGKRVTRRELLASGAVSDRYIGGLAELATESEGEANRFLALLEARQDERAKGYQKKKLEELSAWLEEHEFLDRRDCLDLAGARNRVLAASAPSIEGGRLTTEDVLTLTVSIWSALERGVTRRQSSKMSTESPLASEGA